MAKTRLSPADDITVQVGDGEVAIRRRRAGRTVVAAILGRIEREGTTYLYLDSLVHHHGEGLLGEWEVTGAISTILSRPSATPQQIGGHGISEPPPAQLEPA